MYRARCVYSGGVVVLKGYSRESLTLQVGVGGRGWEGAGVAGGRAAGGGWEGAGVAGGRAAGGGWEGYSRESLTLQVGGGGL